ncbi:MAG: hypothetical protein VYC34_05525, partial [Planctomycetota bacterium]|nr:hypothetical protein [Planctomycetota bacterium]
MYGVEPFSCAASYARWSIDCGASDHIVGSKDLIRLYETQPEFGDDHSMATAGGLVKPSGLGEADTP